LKVSTFSPDITISHKDGTYYDSRKERIEKKAYLANLAEKHGSQDSIARSILESYCISISNPDNELVYIYEIFDTLAKRFNGATEACSELELSKSRWSMLGRLANNEPIKQGRHRGKYPGILRDVTEAELKEARDIAQTFIIAYLQYLDKQHH